MREKYVLCNNNVIINHNNSVFILQKIYNYTVIIFHYFYIDVLLCGLVRLTAILPQLSNYIFNLAFTKYLYSVH